MLAKFIKHFPLKDNRHQSEKDVDIEQQWVDKAKKNPKHFAWLYDKYFEIIFQFIFRRIDDEALTADLTSQTFLKALQNIKKYEFRGVPFSAWLYRIAANEVNKYYRDHRKCMIFSLEQDIVLKWIADKEDGTPDEEMIQLVMKYLNELDSEDISILELRFFEDKGFKEIAYILDIKESAAKMRTYRALNKLKINLTPHDSARG